MLDRSFGPYIRVMIDMNLSQPLKSKVLVERQDFPFFMELSYDNLLEFCSHCMTIGHQLIFSKGYMWSRMLWNLKPDKNKDATKSKVGKYLNFVQVRDERQVEPINLDLIDKSTNKSTKHDKSNDMPISKNINLSEVKQVMMDNTPLQDKENRFEALNDFAPSIDEDMEDMFELDSNSSSPSFEFVDAT